MALALNDRVKETTIVTGTGIATLLGSSIGFQPFSVVGNGNTTYYCIADQFGSNWEVGIGTYTTSGNTLARTTVLSSSNAGSLVVFTAGIKDVFVTYPSSKGLWKDASGNAIALGTPAAFVGTNITGTASGLTAGNVTTNANLTGAVTSVGNATSLGSFTSLQLATALTNETGTGSAVFSDNASLLNPTYTGTLTGSTGILNIGSGQVYKDASGNVGIGTSSPTYKLDVQGGDVNLTGSFYAKKESYFGVTNAGYSMNHYTATNWNYSNLNLWRNATNTSTPRFLGMPLDGDSDSSTTIGGYNAIWGAYDSAPTTGSTSSGLNGAMVYGAYAGHRWYTNGTPRMRIDSSGNVGIGTSSPSSRFEVANNSSSAEVRISSTSNVYSSLYLNAWSLDRAQIRAEAGNPGAGSGTGSGILSFWTAGNPTMTERMRLDSSGNLLVGTTSNIPDSLESAKLHVLQTGASAHAASFKTNATSGFAAAAFSRNGNNGAVCEFFYNTTTNVGSISITNSATAYNTSSDQRLKTNIVDAPSALESINAIQVRSFDWKESGEHQEYGYIAQELLEVAPEAVSVPEDATQMMGVDFGKLTPRLVKAIQEQQTLIEALTARLTALEAK
jgi:hypothetical protein